MAQYVNNVDFLEAMKSYRESLELCKSEGKEKPVVPDYIGQCIMDIAKNLAYKANFINYSYREDMILDGIENCLRYIHNFDPEKSSNPFAYFTQIIYYAFLRRIAKEKHQSKLKTKLIQQIPFELYDLQGHDEGGDFTNTYIEFMQSHIGHEDAEPELAAAIKSYKGSSLNEFLEGESLVE